MKDFLKKLFVDKVKETVIDFFLDLFRDTLVEGVDEYKKKRKLDKNEGEEA